MAKKKFYSLCRYIDKTDNNIKVGYMPREGDDVPNNFGFDLAVYRAKDKECSDYGTWYVVDARTGLSVSEGDTKKEAVANVLSRLESFSEDKYKEAVLSVEKAYGPVPGNRITYNFLMN